MACDYTRPGLAHRRSPASSSRRSPRTCWTAPDSPPRRRCKAAGLDWHGSGPRAAGRRLDPHAHGPRDAPAGFGQGARRLGGGRRGRGPRRRAARRLAAGPAATASRPSFEISNVNSHSLGVVGIDPATERNRNGILIPRNTPLPVTAKRTFRTQKANQRSILVQIVEGESPSADDCNADRPVRGQRSARQPAAQSPVDVHFQYEPNGRLKVPGDRGRHRSPGAERDHPRKHAHPRSTSTAGGNTLPARPRPATRRASEQRPATFALARQPRAFFRQIDR